MSTPRRRPRACSAVLVLIALSAGPGPLDQPANPATTPVDRKGAWEAQHRAFVEAARAGNVDLLFLGDSICALWSTANPSAWERHYAPRRPANFGIGGDRTQHLLWRLDHGELEGIKPRVVVVLIGTNNVGHDTEDQIVGGVAAVVDRLRAKLPESKVLLLGIFPRGADRNSTLARTAPDPRISRLNARLAGLGEGPGVRFLDLGAAFLDESGQIPRALMPDFLHLSRKGYQAWADAMEPTLWDMMERK